ncbi:hypothetical protein EV673_1886 [Limnobacter thiooxidans]|uniref:Uncharacterized protein n=1 Tax=Limnobacter thiooxidans TaxID=131080 RepID=A0AA86JHY2_9BURK|nr:hypothetical protein [Limnobacter sp.]MCZ8016039.1 hypothetical protein [Limnobacter sp.]RZS40127.1 hypothetical protein EV673_1886 [Limnobacter thiooxidans]BET27441.1 hypothetical protein RGQ30_29420 [Limnobacter thiooxidans]
MDKTLLIRARVQGLDALLTLNGMVLCKLISDQEIRLPVHEFIQSGENRIQVLALGPQGVQFDSALAPVDCGVKVSVELQKDRGGESLVQAHVLFDLGENFKKGHRLEKGRMLDVTVNLPVSFNRWRYLDVLQSGADETDHIKIQDFVLRLAGLFQTKKVSLLLPYFSVRNQEVASAYGLDMQQAHAAISTRLNLLCSTFNLSEESLDSASWLFHKVRQSSVYALLNSRYQPLFQFESTENQNSHQWPMHVGVLGGEVFVLR